MPNDTVRRDAYFCIHTTMQSGFECLIPARGYNLKSWLAFEDRLGAKYEYDEITEQAYIHLMLGDPNDPLGEKYGPASKGTAQQETAPKRGRGKTKAEDSKSTRTPRKTTAPTSKEKPSVVRKSPVRNVRKPKKDVQGTNNSGTKTPTRSRKSTGST
jgi:hypothetical protein